MVVNTLALWGTIATCCVAALPSTVKLKVRNARESGSPLPGALIDGVMTGLAVGMGAAAILFMTIATVVQLAPG